MNVDWGRLHRVGGCVMCLFMVLFASAEVLVALSVGEYVGYGRLHQVLVVGLMVPIGAVILTVLRRGEVLWPHSPDTEGGETT